jgi:hypothetical protein
MTQQPTVVLMVRVYPSGTPGTVLIETEQQGPVHLTADEIARTLRSAATRFDTAEPPEAADAQPVIDMRELTGHHDDGYCPGINSCERLQDIWRGLAKGVPGTCMLCDGVHWPWENHHASTPHPYRPGGAGWCMRIVYGRTCGKPWDADIHQAQEGPQ